MVNFSPELPDQTEDQLKSGINNHSPNFALLESNELVKRSVNKLQETIKVFNEQSSKQTKKMILLTWWIVILTVAMLLGLTIQIVLAIFK